MTLRGWHNLLQENHLVEDVNHRGVDQSKKLHDLTLVELLRLRALAERARSQ